MSVELSRLPSERLLGINNTLYVTEVYLVCFVQQELPGGREPAGKDRRLWHVQRRLQH